MKPTWVSAFISILTLLETDALASIGIHFSFVIEHDFLSNGDALAGVAIPARASVSNSVAALMNAEALAGFVPIGPQSLLVACS